jgi:hypothetical protein
LRRSLGEIKPNAISSTTLCIISSATILRPFLES